MEAATLQVPNARISCVVTSRWEGETGQGLVLLVVEKVVVCQRGLKGYHDSKHVRR